MVELDQAKHGMTASYIYITKYFGFFNPLNV